MTERAVGKSWKHIVVGPELTLGEALKVLDSGGLRLLLVADEAERLLGMVTDGDVRRALLRQVTLNCPVTKAMNTAPRTARVGDGRDVIRALMERHGLLHVPLLDAERRLAGLETYDGLRERPEKDAWVFLMAGGFGTRLRPLTDDCPKPMLHVGGRPILETILERFVAAGFRRFFISVHYLADRIKAHFGDGSRWGVSLHYIEEESPLGTGGALGLLPDTGDRPVIVMNGDVLTQLDFGALLDFHCSRDSALTLCVREYDMQVPFGVVEGNGEQVTGIVEKPVHRFFVNAGIYVVSPGAVARTRPARRLDMPDLVDGLVREGATVSMFPVHEYWIDVGRPDDFESAQRGPVV